MNNTNNILNATVIKSKGRFISNELKKVPLILPYKEYIWEIKTGYDISQSLLDGVSIKKESEFMIREDLLYFVKHHNVNEFIVSSFSIRDLEENFGIDRSRMPLTIIGDFIYQYLNHALDTEISELNADFIEDPTGVFFKISNGTVPKHVKKRLKAITPSLSYIQSNTVSTEELDFSKISFSNLTIQISNKF